MKEEVKSLKKSPQPFANSIIQSSRDKYNISAKKITRLANSALRLGGIRIPNEQKRVDTVNIDTDDEDSFMDDNNEESMIDEELEVNNDEEDDDFDEITDQLSDIPDISLQPSSLYVNNI